MDIDEVTKAVETGILRAGVFLGFGINSIRAGGLNHHLTAETRLHLTPDLTEEQLSEATTEYRKWIVAGGFRELVEHLTLFFDRLFNFCNHIAPQPIKVVKDFAQAGLHGKIDKLGALFGLTIPAAELFRTLGPVRNCFVHRLGLVGAKDAKDGPIVLKWTRLELILRHDYGDEEVPMRNEHYEPKPLEKETPLCLKIAVHEKEFRAGEYIDLSPADLNDILLFCRDSAHAYLKEFLAWAEARGVRRLSGE